jgi:hypothetical protein
MGNFVFVHFFKRFTGNLYDVFPKNQISKDQIIEHDRKNFLKDKDIDEQGYLKIPEDNLIEPFSNWDNSDGKKVSNRNCSLEQAVN